VSNTNTLPFETTLHIRDTCLCLHVQRAARSLARRFDDALRPCGLTNGQFSLLNALNRPGDQDGPADQKALVSMAAVASLLAMDRTTLTAALKPLQRDGLVEISPDPRDRRARRLRLTAAGHARLLAAVPLWQATHRVVEASLPDGQGQGLRAGLRALG